MFDFRKHNKALDQLEDDIERETYLFTRDEINSMCWRIGDLRNRLAELCTKVNLNEDKFDNTAEKGEMHND